MREREGGGESSYSGLVAGRSIEVILQTTSPHLFPTTKACCFHSIPSFFLTTMGSLHFNAIVTVAGLFTQFGRPFSLNTEATTSPCSIRPTRLICCKGQEDQWLVLTVVQVVHSCYCIYYLLLSDYDSSIKHPPTHNHRARKLISKGPSKPIPWS